MNKILTCICILVLLFFAGCKTNDLIIETTQPWENHYHTVKEFKEKTQSIQLSKGESIWVISNKTLSRVLKNYSQNNIGK